MPPFGICGRAPEVVRERVVHFFLVKLIAYAEGSEIVRVVAHPGVFPVDQADVAVFLNKEIKAEEVVVTQHRFAAFRFKQLMEFRCLRFHVCPIRNVDGAPCQERLFVTFAFVVEAEATFDGSVRLVQLTCHSHCFLQLGIVFRVEVFAVGNEL